MSANKKTSTNASSDANLRRAKVDKDAVAAGVKIICCPIAPRKTLHLNTSGTVKERCKHSQRRTLTTTTAVAETTKTAVATTNLAKARNGQE